ncbi:hypothetical protein D3C81_1164770 [compost metagenome]
MSVSVLRIIAAFSLKVAEPVKMNDAPSLSTVVLIKYTASSRVLITLPVATAAAIAASSTVTPSPLAPNCSKVTEKLNWLANQVAILPNVV